MKRLPAIDPRGLILKFVQWRAKRNNISKDLITMYGVFIFVVSICLGFAFSLLGGASDGAVLWAACYKMTQNSFFATCIAGFIAYANQIIMISSASLTTLSLATGKWREKGIYKFFTLTTCLLMVGSLAFSVHLSFNTRTYVEAFAERQMQTKSDTSVIKLKASERTAIENNFGMQHRQLADLHKDELKSINNRFASEKIRMKSVSAHRMRQYNADPENRRWALILAKAAKSDSLVYIDRRKVAAIERSNDAHRTAIKQLLEKKSGEIEEVDEEKDQTVAAIAAFNNRQVQKYEYNVSLGESLTKGINIAFNGLTCLLSIMGMIFFVAYNRENGKLPPVTPQPKRTGSLFHSVAGSIAKAFFRPRHNPGSSTLPVSSNPPLTYIGSDSRINDSAGDRIEGNVESQPNPVTVKNDSKNNRTYGSTMTGLIGSALTGKKESKMTGSTAKAEKFTLKLERGETVDFQNPVIDHEEYKKFVKLMRYYWASSYDSAVKSETRKANRKIARVMGTIFDCHGYRVLQCQESEARLKVDFYREPSRPRNERDLLKYIKQYHELKTGKKA